MQEIFKIHLCDLRMRARWESPTSHSNTYPVDNSFDRSELTVRHRWATSREITRHMTIITSMRPNWKPEYCRKGVLPSHSEASRENTAHSPSQSGTMRGEERRSLKLSVVSVMNRWSHAITQVHRPWRGHHVVVLADSLRWKTELLVGRRVTEMMQSESGPVSRVHRLEGPPWTVLKDVFYVITMAESPPRQTPVSEKCPTDSDARQRPSRRADAAGRSVWPKQRRA
jgi:hypothetical protein